MSLFCSLPLFLFLLCTYLPVALRSPSSPLLVSSPFIPVDSKVRAFRPYISTEPLRATDSMTPTRTQCFICPLHACRCCLVLPRHWLINHVFFFCPQVQYCKCSALVMFVVGTLSSSFCGFLFLVAGGRRSARGTGSVKKPVNAVFFHGRGCGWMRGRSGGDSYAPCKDGGAGG